MFRSDIMKFTVIGAGAMGLRYGILLQEAGNQVDFVDAWEEHVATIEQNGGVYVSRDHKDRHLVPVNIYRPQDYHVTDQDCLIVFMKQMQLEKMLADCKHFFTKDQYVLSAMNGMGHVEKLQQYFADDKIIAGTALIATILPGPGEVDFIGTPGAGSMNLANLTEKPDDFTHKLVDQLKAANLNPTLTTNFMGTLMAKVIFNSVVNTLCTLFEITMGEYASFGNADELSRALIDEAYDVCERADITLLSTRKGELDTVNYVSKVANPLHYPSMYQDMSKNRPTEVDYINGYIVKLGRKYNYEAKTHAFLTNLVHLAEHTRQNK